MTNVFPYVFKYSYYEVLIQRNKCTRISKAVLKREDKQGTCIGRCQTKLCGTGMGDKYINGTG